MSKRPKMSKKMKELWKDPIYRERRAKGWDARKKRKLVPEEEVGEG